MQMDYTLNINGNLLDLTEPKVMGIINITPDSFFADSRKQTDCEIAEYVEQMITDGVDIIDVGACSTRPQSIPVTVDEERKRLRFALPIINKSISSTAHDKIVALSIDTYRAEIAKMCIEEYGANIINDVSGGSDQNMFSTVSQFGMPYILTAQQSNLHDTLMFFATNVDKLRNLGQKDIILDPGFGFGKTIDENFALLKDLDKLSCMDLPIMVGLSRKSFIYKVLDCLPEDSLTGTTALNMVSLQKGASILRVHDVKAAVEIIKMVVNCNL